MAAIADIQGVSKEIVLQERVTTTDYKIREIQESIENRYVHVELELGPFVQEERPGGQFVIRGTSRRRITAWENAEYDAIRDTWTNADLIAVIKTKMES